MTARECDASVLPTAAERRGLLEVNRAASRFFRRELLRAKGGWAREYVVRGGAPELLALDSKWAIGYAPDAPSRLVDHLRSRGFKLETVRNAGLGVLNPEGRTVDRFRDQVMFPAWNDHLETVGFTAVRGIEKPYYATSPATAIHQRRNALIGVAEQIDLLTDGASPVLVNHPLDAVAVERISRLTIGRWAGIPLCDFLLSAGQAHILGRYAAIDTAIVVLTDDKAGRRAAVSSLNDLSRFFTRVRAVELPAGQSPSSLAVQEDGMQRLHDGLLVTRPLSDYRPHQQPRRPPPLSPTLDPNPSDQTPSL
ncbi:hypothetical protein AB0H36_44050 [Kribbella sp. NPDC050820]|uniref:hypothetical protein n=1 Tax=Kribbella sp. NPDC050820 TaxID=3155408 RepID=UPI0033DE01DF